MHRPAAVLLLISASLAGSCGKQSDPPTPDSSKAAESKAAALKADHDALVACAERLKDPILSIADTRELRFQGKVETRPRVAAAASAPAAERDTPWVDWSNYWGDGRRIALAGASEARQHRAASTAR